MQLFIKIIQEEIKANENLKWKRFIDRQGKHPTNSSPFWKRINFHKSRNNSIKTLNYTNKFYHTDLEKANLFADIQEQTFSEEKNDNFDPKFKKIYKYNII